MALCSLQAVAARFAGNRALSQLARALRDSESAAARDADGELYLNASRVTAGAGVTAF
jgi:hypothetical protein